MTSESVDRASVDIAGTEISFETGKLAKQAGGSVVVRAGDTMVLCTATAGNLRDVDFLPLTVDVEERMYAAGKIPGSFFKREGRPSEKGILTARMIDRPIRPLFPKGWHRETQIVATPMCIDHVHPYDILAMNGASAALALSDIPFPTQMGAVRIGKLEGKFVVNPAEADLPESELDLVVAGTDDALLMVEAGANEITEAELLDALDIAHEEIKKLCAAQRELARAPRQGEDRGRVAEGRRGPAGRRSSASHGADLDRATQVEDKLERQDATKAVEEAVLAKYARRRGATSRRPAAPRRGAARVRQAREGHHPAPDRGRQAPPRRPRARTRSARSRPRSASRRARTAPRSSPAARRRRTRSRRSARAARSSAWTRSGSRRPSATSTTTTSRRSRSGRPASCAGPSAATSATGRSPSGRSLPMIPSHGGVPVHDPRRVRHPRVQRLLVDGLGVRFDAVADGRRREDPASRWPASRWA